MAGELTLEQGQRILESLPDAVARALDDQQREHVEEIARRARAEALGVPAAVAAFVAPTIRADGLELVAGGSTPTSGGGTASDVLYGSMFGSVRYPQFPGYRSDGYYLIADVEDLAAGADPWGQHDSDALGEAVRDA